jgi:hypothetical protein
MLAAKRAELAQLHALGFGLFVLGLAIVFPLAFGTLQCNDFAHRSLPFSRSEFKNPRKSEVEESGKRRCAATIFLDFLNS